jgi:hypothetical protein
MAQQEDGVHILSSTARSLCLPSLVRHNFLIMFMSKPAAYKKIIAYLSFILSQTC